MEPERQAAQLRVEIVNKRKLGRTNLMVSQIGFGGTWLAELSSPEAQAVVKHAFDLGINYFDTARWDGDSEEKIGAALQDVRSQCVIATKTGSRTKRESLEDFESSLKRLRSDHLDIIQLHGIDNDKTLSKAMGSDGSLQTCKEAQHEGLVDFIGITGHKPRVLAKAVATGEFDTVLVPINVVTRQALEELLPVAKTYDVGVVAMKPLSAKTSNLVTCLYQPSLSLVSDEPELRKLLGETKEKQVSSALHFVLSQDISVVIPGLKSLNEVETATNAGNTYGESFLENQPPLNVSLGDYCRDCGMCMSCPEGINIAAVLRFYGFYSIFGLKEWAKKLYHGLDVKADSCKCCGQCESTCPYNLPITKRLDNAHRNFNY